MASRLEEDLGFLVARTHRAMRRWLMTLLEPMGLTYEQFRVIRALCEEEDVSQVALADRVNADQTSLARMLDRMTKAGLILRCADPEDSRVNRVTLTEKGRDLALHMMPRRELALGKALEGLSEKEVQELRRVLKQIHRNLSS
jgi:DNA-binding MarR family transcriptional regulator